MSTTTIVADDLDAERILDDLGKTPRRGGARMAAFWFEVGTLGRMARAVMKGEYTLATQQVIMVLAALGYVVSPADAVPDPIPALGLADDAGVVMATIAVLATEIACFRVWEESQGSAG